MKLSFSTNGWTLSFEELLQQCFDNKIYGLEIHDVFSSCFSSLPFEKKQRQKNQQNAF